MQAFEKAVDYSQKIVDSVLLIFGGSIAVLFGTGYQRPANKWMPSIYLLFPVELDIPWSFNTEWNAC